MLAMRLSVLVLVFFLPYVIYATSNDDLNRAASTGDLAGVQEALKKGADCNNHESQSGSTPLMDAAYAGNVAIVVALIKARANVNAKDNRGTTVLMHAISPNRHDNSQEVVRLLIGAGANVNAGKENFDTALIRAVRSGNLEMVKLLIAAGANVRAAGSGGHTALTAAASLGHAQIVGLLIKAKADINIKTQYGESAIAIARTWGHTEVVKLLKGAGAKESEPALASKSAPESETARPARNGTKLQKTGYAEIDAMLSNCWIFDITDAERQPGSFCHQMVDCIGTKIDKSHSCSHASNLVCANYENDISTRTIKSCAGKKTLRGETEKRAMKFAEWVWRKKNYPDAGNLDSTSGKNTGNTPRPREKSENQKWRECHASGQSGCGYR